SLLQLLILIISLGLVGLLTWSAARTKLGLGMRTIAENPHAAAVVGVNSHRATTLTFAIRSALGASARPRLASDVYAAGVGSGHAVELKGLAIIIVGGLGALPGALVGGLLLGLAEVYAVNYIGTSWRDMVAFGLLFMVLVARPQGIFGAKKEREV